MTQIFSPYINHFIQPDSIIPNPSDPQSLNRYSYVQNNPIRFNDPSGHIAECDDIDGCSDSGMSYCERYPDTKSCNMSDDDPPVPEEGTPEYMEWLIDAYDIQLPDNWSWDFNCGPHDSSRAEALALPFGAHGGTFCIYDGFYAESLGDELFMASSLIHEGHHAWIFEDTVVNYENNCSVASKACDIELYGPLLPASEISAYSLQVQFLESYGHYADTFIRVRRIQTFQEMINADKSLNQSPYNWHTESNSCQPICWFP